MSSSHPKVDASTALAESPEAENQISNCLLVITMVADRSVTGLAATVIVVSAASAAETMFRA